MFIGQITRSALTNRGELLSRHNRCPHRLIAHVVALVPGIRHGGDTMTGGVLDSLQIVVPDFGDSSR